jgi:hypothetical protein
VLLAQLAQLVPQDRREMMVELAQQDHPVLKAGLEVLVLQEQLVLQGQDMVM